MHKGTHVKRQYASLFIFFCLWAALFARVGFMQLFEHERLHARALDQRVKPMTLKSRRGRILDRHGVEMAICQLSASYGISPQYIQDADESAKMLSTASGMGIRSVRSLVKSDKPFVWLVRQPEPAILKKLDALDLQGFRRHAEYRRSYPLGTIGAHILGFTDIDNKGIEGCELFLNEYLQGVDGRSMLLRDAQGRSAPSLDEPLIDPVHGNDVVLTIDWRLQEIAEEELAETVESTKAKWGGVLMMDAETGDILAMANVPLFDPNNTKKYSKSGEDDIFRNRLVTDMFEPGSTFKVVTFAEALESGAVTEDDMINCESGKYRLYGHTINDAHKLGMVSARDVLVHSSNIGTIKIAEKIGKKRLYKRARQMGFGEVTGIDVPYESPGVLHSPSEWSKLSLPTISFGQGVAVTPLQLVAAYGAIAHNGELMTPHLVKEVRDTQYRKGISTSPQVIRRIMKPDTARRLTELLCGVVEDGTGKNASLTDVRIAGKTGTAQRVKEGVKGYVAGTYISSFIGFIADRDPAIVCLVLVDTPRGVYYGSQVAAPVFRNIMNRMLNLGDGIVEPALVAEVDTTVIDVRPVPDLNGMPVAEAVAAISSANLKAVVRGDSTVVSNQFPLAGARVTAGSEVTIYGHTVAASKPGNVKVPDLRGKTVRQAVQDLVKANLKVSIDGSGVVSDQKPNAGAVVAYGTVCRIACRKR